MKAWIALDPEGFAVYARADTRNQAKRFWLSYVTTRYEEALNLRVLRQPWLDGPGPAREIETEWVPCTDEDYGPDGYSDVCFEGEKLDQAKTLARLAGS